MKEFKTSVTSVIAAMILVFGFLLLFGVLFLHTPIDSATRTQIISIDGSIMLLAATFYFGASKQHANPNPPTANIEQADNVTVNKPTLTS